MEEVNGVISQVPHHILDEAIGFSEGESVFLGGWNIYRLMDSGGDMMYVRHSSLAVSLTSYAGRDFLMGRVCRI